MCLLITARPPLSAQSSPPPSTPPATSAPVPLLPAEGLTDENGWTWPGAEWKHVPPESEGFSAARLEALRSFLDNRRIMELVMNVAFYNAVVRILVPCGVELEPTAKKN